MAEIDLKNLTLVREPFEIILDFFRQNSSHPLNNVNISLFRLKLFILFLFIAGFKIILSNLGIVSKLFNVVFVALLGIVIIEALIGLFSFYIKVVEGSTIKGILKFFFLFIVFVVILGVF